MDKNRSSWLIGEKFYCIFCGSTVGQISDRTEQPVKAVFYCPGCKVNYCDQCSYEEETDGITTQRCLRCDSRVEKCEEQAGNSGGANKTGIIPVDIKKGLEDKIREGYRLLSRGACQEGCDVWLEVWKTVVAAMDTYGIEYIEDFDKKFRGKESIYNWASDFEMELGNAARDNKDYAVVRIDFCREYTERYRDQTDLNILNMKVAIAESHYLLGREEEGERLFRKFLEENPTWGWGWISWSDIYRYVHEENADSNKAVDILKKALAVENLQDREEVKLRLKELYYDLGMTKEGDAIVVNHRQRKQFREHKFKLPSVRVVKVGRNEPCPCGSGKKYKKCCGGL